VRRVPGNLEHFVVVVVRHQRLVRIQLLECLVGLDRVGVDDPVPDEVLALLVRKVFDVLVNGQEFGDAGDIEARARLVERSDDFRRAVGLHGVVDLHPRQILAELGVVVAQRLVIDDNERRPVSLRESKERAFVH